MPTNSKEWIAALIVGAVVASWLVQGIRAAVGLIFGHWYVAVSLGCCLVLAIAALGRWRVAATRSRTARLRQLRLTLPQLDQMEPLDFEFAVRDLMVRDGIDARQVGGRGDKAADVIGHDERGYRIVVQCKHTTTGGKVGAPVIYQVNGTAGPAHGADVAVVVTNGSFTQGAQDSAAQFRIHLVDRHALHRWAATGVPLQRLLGLTTPLRHRRRLLHTAARLMHSQPLRSDSRPTSPHTNPPLADSQEVT